MASSRLGTCYLCLTTAKITREDVVPSWVRRTLLAGMPKGYATPARYVMPLCQPCNHSLGARFENWAALKLKPMVLGEVITLDRDDQTRIAAWALMKDIEFAMARETIYRHGEAPAAQTAASREPFRQMLLSIADTGVPLVNASVRVGLTGDLGIPYDTTAFIPASLDTGAFALTSIAPWGAAVTETVIGGTAPIQPFVDSTQADVRLVRVWPIQSDEVTIGAVRIEPLAPGRLMREFQHNPTNQVGGGFARKVRRVDSSELTK